MGDSMFIDVEAENRKGSENVERCSGRYEDCEQRMDIPSVYSD